MVATYAHDIWGNLTTSSEGIPNASCWLNPYRFDGRDSVRSVAATRLDWVATRELSGFGWSSPNRNLW